MKNRSLFLLFIFLSAFGYNLFSQSGNDPILMTVAGENITKSEFLNIYQKNNKNDVIDKKSLDEYVELFINFKLKVKEAEALKLDTAKSFTNELGGYRKQLALPYLTDKDVNDFLLQQSYERLQKDIRASHILIKLDKNASPKDTLAAYKKIMDIRSRLMKGEDFAKVAMEVSDDPSAKGMVASKTRPAQPGNGGDLGYFTAFDMVYPFENGAFSVKKGEITMPVRTDFGYHLIKVTDIKDAMNKVQVAHILLMYPPNATAQDSVNMKNKIQEAYKKIQEGMPFDTVVQKYSEDKGSARKGGLLPWFGVNRMVPEFIIAIAKLKNKGDVSEPFSSQYGWHIIKLIDRKESESFDKMKPDLKQRISKDARSNKSKDSFIQKIKSENAFKENTALLEPILNVLTDSIFNGKWDVNLAKDLKANLFTIAGNNYSQYDLAVYISKHQVKSTPEPKDNYLNRMYKAFVDETCTNYEDSQLENKYPPFKSLMKEYRDGILLFDLTDQKVWTKAIKDTTGLKNFHNLNAKNYLWGDRVEGVIYSCIDEKTADETMKLVKKAAKKGLTDNDIKTEINKTSDKNLLIERGKFSKGDNKIIDGIEWKPGITPISKIDGKFVIINLIKNLPPEPKTLSEAKGLITADYQNFLEKEWIKELRAKYTFSVNKDVLNTIK